ncbi:MAG: hypothetical protein IPL35_01275 [Sphingobacteriales bacterium]|nr:hypothetical protein [Sphingobacteriales bacterium]
MMGKNVLNADSGSKQYCSSTAAENLQKKGFVTAVDDEGMITAKKVDAGTGDITTVSACPHSGKVITTQTCGKTGKVMSTETTEFSALQNGEEVVKEAKSQDASVLPAGPACNGGAKKGCCKKDGAKKD